MSKRFLRYKSIDIEMVFNAKNYKEAYKELLFLDAEKAPFSDINYKLGTTEYILKIIIIY